MISFDIVIDVEHRLFNDKEKRRDVNFFSLLPSFSLFISQTLKFDPKSAEPKIFLDSQVFFYTVNVIIQKKTEVCISLNDNTLL